MNILANITSSILAEAEALVRPEVLAVLLPILLIFMAILGAAAIICVLLQKADTGNMGALSGETETYMGKNKGSRTEFRLKVATVVMMALLLVLSIIYFIVQR